MMSNIDDFTELVFRRGKEKYLKKKMERKIFDRNKNKKAHNNPVSGFKRVGCVFVPG